MVSHKFEHPMSTPHYFRLPLILSVTHMFFIPGLPWGPWRQLFPGWSVPWPLQETFGKVEQMKDANNGNKMGLWDSYATMGYNGNIIEIFTKASLAFPVFLACQNLDTWPTKINGRTLTHANSVPVIKMAAPLQPPPLNCRPARSVSAPCSWFFLHVADSGCQRLCNLEGSVFFRPKETEN